MDFLNPTAGYWALLAIPIILFYILKIKLRREPVSTTIFWEQVFEERRSRSFWRRLRHLMSLILSLVFLAILVGAIAEPVRTSRHKPARCVIVVDNSAGMNAATESGGLSRLDRAKKELYSLLSTVGLARETALLACGGEPRIIVGFTEHLGTLRKGVEAIEPTDYPAAMKQAVELAERLIALEDDSTILVYTDGEIDELEELRNRPKVRFCPVGTPVENLAITRFQPRRTLGDATGYEILAETVFFGREKRETRLEVELNGRLIDVVPLTLEPGVPRTTIIRDTTAEGGLLRARLKNNDLFPADDTAIAFLPECSLQPLYYFGVEDFFLIKVLQSQPNTELHLLTEAPDRVPENGVLILHQTVPDVLPEGNVVVVDPRDSCDCFEAGEPLEVPLIAKEDRESPLMQFVHLRNLSIPGARRITPRNERFARDADEKETDAKAVPKTQVLAETPEGSPVYFQWSVPDRDVLVLTAELARGDLALRTAFPILISQALNHFRGSGGELDPAVTTSDPVRISLKTVGDRVLLRSPSGKELAFPVQSGTVTLGTLPECGVWEIMDDNRDKEMDRREKEIPSKRIACNLCNLRESNLRSAPASFYEQDVASVSLRSGTWPIWFWLTLTALVFTVVEWFLYQRRWID